MSVEIRHRSDNDLRSVLREVLARYPWFSDYPSGCHVECDRRVIDSEHGTAAGDAWHEYDTALWLLTGRRAGA